MTAVENPMLVLDPEETRRLRRERLERIGSWVLPMLIMVLAIWLWDRICVWNEIRNTFCRAPAWWRRRSIPIAGCCSARCW